MHKNRKNTLDDLWSSCIAAYICSCIVMYCINKKQRRLNGGT